MRWHCTMICQNRFSQAERWRSFSMYTSASRCVQLAQRAPPDLSTALHPRQRTDTVTMPISPPVVGITFLILRVCSPERTCSLTSSTSGSKRRLIGSDSWCSRYQSVSSGMLLSRTKMGSSAFSHALALAAPLTITYGIRSPTFGARPGSRFRMRSASTTCACRLPASYWSAERVNAFEMTSLPMSISFISSLEIWRLTYEIALSGSPSIRMLRSEVSTTSFTSSQLSRRTVSIPLQSM
mmetsp:Transcript_36640/g.112334  ORF Transcript_36640/g.112334 Transcript_36640/m.112334 type:complete len:239 (-) Transcript_36640:957-1673(-)